MIENAVNKDNYSSESSVNTAKTNQQKSEDGIELEGEKFIFASMNRRLIASVLDMMVILFFIGPILNAMNYYIYGGKTPTQILQEFGERYSNVKDGALLLQYLYNEGFIIKYLIAQFIALFIFGIFMVAFWKWKGATPGKMLTRCVIVDASTGAMPTIKQSIIRFLGYIVSTIPLCIGFLVIPITKKKQGFHDMLANTVVVIKSPRKQIN
jgi:hypothetical protein